MVDAEYPSHLSAQRLTIMKLGFICINVPGHLNPITALARQLQARNHDVVFLYSPGGAGLPFIPANEKDHFNENRPELSKMQGEDALQFSLRRVLDQNGVDIEDVAGHCTSKPDRRSGNRYHSILCGIRCDAVGHTIPTCVRRHVP